MNTAPQDNDARIDLLLATLWKKNLPTLKLRLEMLDRAATASASGQLNDAQRAEAQSVAHKLSGSLGMFGYNQGTVVARQVEALLKNLTPADAERFVLLTIELREALADGLLV